MLKPSSCSKLSYSRSYRNSFGLPRVKTCPGRTTLCEKVCYPKRQEAMYPSVLPVLKENLATCEELLDEQGSQGLSHYLAEMVPWGTKRVSEFRIHWDGDFYSPGYTFAWHQAILRRPEVDFWAYTRSFEYVHFLRDLPNLRLYLSLDQENWREGFDVHKANPWTLISTMGMIPETALVLTRHGCPEFDNLCDLLTQNGLPHHWFNCPAIAPGPLRGVKGACLRCRVCFASKSRNILNFPIHK